MIAIKIHLSETIRCVVNDKPPILSLESRTPVTIRQIAHDIVIPAALIVFASVDGVKMNLDDIVDKDVKVHLFGTMSGG